MAPPNRSSSTRSQEIAFIGSTNREPNPQRMRCRTDRYKNMKTFRTILLLSALLVVTPSHGAVFQTVTSLADSGSGTLRATLASAGNGDTIRFSPGLTGT